MEFELEEAIRWHLKGLGSAHLRDVLIDDYGLCAELVDRLLLAVLKRHPTPNLIQQFVVCVSLLHQLRHLDCEDQIKLARYQFEYTLGL